MHSTKAAVQELVDEATFQFTLGENALALKILDEALTLDPESFAAWHAKTEIHFSQHETDQALAAGEKAYSLAPDDIHINTSLSRIWIQKGNKQKAEHFNAKTRMLGWKEVIETGES